MDFALTKEGDLCLSSSGSLEIVQHDDLKMQSAHCRMQSVKTDWYLDQIGANLESLIGLPSDSDTIELGKALMTSALTEHGLYSSDEIYIEVQSVRPVSLGYLVYLKTAERRARLLQVTIDALEGVTIKEGGPYANES